MSSWEVSLGRLKQFSRHALGGMKGYALVSAEHAGPRGRVGRTMLNRRSVVDGVCGSDQSVPGAVPIRQEPVLRFKKMSTDAHAPRKAYPLAAGFDLHSAQPETVPAHGKALIRTAIQIQLPPGCYGRIAPRSGLALRNHITVGAGVVDEDYRGEIYILLFNHSPNDFIVERGDRIAQIICEKIFYPSLVEVDVLKATEREGGCFGSSGLA